LSISIIEYNEDNGLAIQGQVMKLSESEFSEFKN